MVDKKATLIIQLKDLASKGMSRIGGSMAKLGNWVQKNKIQFALLGAGIGFLGKKMLDAADKMEQWSISFETMIGNAGDAKRLMEEIKDFAKETPFELPDVVKGAKSLLAYGVALEDIIPSLKMMGDVSAGLGVPMERLILNFGQVKAQAKLTGRELRDFAVAGVPMLATLAQNLNKTESEISDMVSKGKIGFKDVEQAFKSMSGEGGRFNNLMQKQMGTLTGVVSNLQDSIFQLAAEFGETMLPTAKDIALSIGGLIEKFKTHKDQYAAFIDMIVFWAETVVSMFVFVGQTVGTVFGQ
ncbi:MAG: tape measure protein, partial [Thermodesulfobacteriota bacterium]|nr:tape measure protein [Thermodesulfobacteriota bacterium]